MATATEMKNEIAKLIVQAESRADVVWAELEEAKAEKEAKEEEFREAESDLAKLRAKLRAIGNTRQPAS